MIIPDRFEKTHHCERLGILHCSNYGSCAITNWYYFLLKENINVIISMLKNLTSQNYALYATTTIENYFPELIPILNKIKLLG